MIHRTYRSLDAPVKLLGLSWRQWLCLITGGGALIAAVHFIGIPARPAISLCTITIGVPLALAYLSEETGFSLGRLVADMARWRLERHAFEPGAREDLVALVVRTEEES
jgi:PrgI family protein